MTNNMNIITFAESHGIQLNEEEKLTLFNLSKGVTFSMQPNVKMDTLWEIYESYQNFIKGGDSK